MIGSRRTEKIRMNSDEGWRDERTGRVADFGPRARGKIYGGSRAVQQRAEPSDASMLGDEPLGEPCKAARMRGQVDLLPPQRKCCGQTGAAGGRTPFRRPGPHPARRDAIERNRLRSLWRRDPREPGRTIMLVAADEATCRAWAARQGVQLDVLDRDLPAFSDACRWIWARMSRGLISDDDLTAKLARLRNRITEASRAFDHSG